MLEFRKEFRGIKRLVVKVGSNVITKDNAGKIKAKAITKAE